MAVPRAGNLEEGTGRCRRGEGPGRLPPGSV